MSKTITQTTTESDSVELKKNAKGLHDWTIKCYGNDLGVLIESARIADAKLAELYKTEAPSPKEVRK